MTACASFNPSNFVDPFIQRCGVRVIRADVLDLFPSITRGAFDDDPEQRKCGKCGAQVAYYNDLDLLRRTVPVGEIDRLTAPTLRGVDRSLPAPSLRPTRPCSCVCEEDAAETDYGHRKHRNAPTDAFRARHAAAVRAQHCAPPSVTFGGAAEHDSRTRWPSYSPLSGRDDFAPPVAPSIAVTTDEQVARVFDLIEDRELAAEVAARLVLKRDAEPIRALDGFIRDEQRMVRLERVRAEKRARRHDPIVLSNTEEPRSDEPAWLDPAAEVTEEFVDPIGIARDVLRPDRLHSEWTTIAEQMRSIGMTATSFARAFVVRVGRIVEQHPEYTAALADITTPAMIARTYMIVTGAPAAEYQAIRERVKKAISDSPAARGVVSLLREGARSADSPKGRPSKTAA